MFSLTRMFSLLQFWKVLEFVLLLECVLLDVARSATPSTDHLRLSQAHALLVFFLVHARMQASRHSTDRETDRQTDRQTDTTPAHARAHTLTCRQARWRTGGTAPSSLPLPTSMACARQAGAPDQKRWGTVQFDLLPYLSLQHRPHACSNPHPTLFNKDAPVHPSRHMRKLLMRGRALAESQVSEGRGSGYSMNWFSCVHTQCASLGQGNQRQWPWVPSLGNE